MAITIPHVVKSFLRMPTCTGGGEGNMQKEHIYKEENDSAEQRRDEIVAYVV